MADLDYTKLQSNKVVAVWAGPTATGVLGITAIGAPLADELNNVGGTSGMQPWHQTISWSDYGFGIQASATLNEPALSDAATYETFGKSAFGGNVSMFMPNAYDDNSNMHSIIYDLTDTPGTRLDYAQRIDGDVLASVAATDGDFVSAFRVQVEGETNPFTAGESVRRTINMIQKSEFAPFVVVGVHTITTIPAGPTSLSIASASTGRFRALQGGRDVTGYLEWATDDGTVIEMFPGGFYNVTGAASATANVTATDPLTGDTATIAVTLAA